MNSSIVIPPLTIGGSLTDEIAKHNARVLRIWMEKGSNCKPFQGSTAAPSADDHSPAAPAPPSLQNRLIGTRHV